MTVDGNRSGKPTSPENDSPLATGTPNRQALTEAERAQAFATGRWSKEGSTSTGGTSPRSARVDRAAAFRAGTVPVPRRFMIWAIAAFVVLGLGGVLAERLIGNAGVGALLSTPNTTLAGTGGSGPTTLPTLASGTPGSTPAAPPAPVQPDAPAVGAVPSAVIGLTRLAGKPAPPISLQSPDGSLWTLGSARGKVVVLTFFDSECDDICPVLAQEIVAADQLLGSRRGRVEFVVVNSDPLETSLSPTPPALTETGLSALPNATFLDGSLASLNSVWKSYGVTIAIDDTTRIITHTEVMYFVSPSGSLALSASPFADEAASGVYSLPSSTVHSFARGVAQTATSLIHG